MAQPQKKAVPADTGHAAPLQRAASNGRVDSTRYAAPLASLANAKKQLAEIELALEASVKAVEGTEEERRREGDTYTFDLKLAREKQLADFAKQDAERDSAATARENSLSIAEGDFSELLGIEVIQGNHLAMGKALRTALDAKLKEQFEAGKTDGTASAQARYAIEKRIDTATASKDLELLKQKNEQLEAANGDLKLQNQKLSEALQKAMETNADVAKKGLEAAGGVVAQGNSALGSAATGFGGSTRPGR